MANQIYCKHCGKPIDADSTFCMHCGGAIQIEVKIEVSLPTSNTAKEEDSFIRLVDAGAAKASIKLIHFVKQYWKRILIFVFGVGGAAGLIYLGIEEFEYARAMFIVPAILMIIATIYFSCSKSIKLLIPSGVVLLCAYGVYIYNEHDNIYAWNTTFFDTIKREFYWITPNYTIPDHVTYINQGAFYGCTLIKSITIPNSDPTIEDGAFAGCKSLERIVIQNASMWDKVKYAFRGSDFNIRIVIDGIHYDWDGDVVGCDKTVRDAIIQDTTGTTDSLVFLDNKARSIKIKTTTIKIPNRVKNIRRHAFEDCWHLTSVTIPDSVRRIESSAFSNCNKLTSITIPNSVRYIGEYAFWGCDCLREVYCKSTIPPTTTTTHSLGGDPFFNTSDKSDKWNAFKYNAPDRKIYVPRNSVKAYKSAEGWKDYANYIVGYDF